MSSGTKSRVDLGSLVDDVLDDWRSLLEEWGNSLHFSQLTAILK